MRKRIPAATRPRVLVAAVVATLVAATGCSSSSRKAKAPEQQASSAKGTTTAAGKPLAGAVVDLFAGTATEATRLGTATTGTDGTFEIAYSPPANGILYLAAQPADSKRLRLLSVVGVLGNEGGVKPQTEPTVVVDELTTVAATFALAQFIGDGEIAGPSPGLVNAAATAFNLEDPATGKAGGAITDANNGGNNESLATLNTLANLVSGCAADDARCAEILRLATPPGGKAPTDTVEAVHNLATNPLLARAELFAIAHTTSQYTPALSAPPESWTLALLYTDDGLYASGRIAFDAKGNMWSSNNWQPGTQEPSTVVSALDPVGNPTFGSPISGGGMKGGAWGIAIAEHGDVWVPSFGGAAMSKYSSTGTPVSPDAGYPNGDLNHPQGTAFDQKGNLWIANNYGPESAPGEGNVVVYPNGDPTKAITITGGGINHPFAVQIDGQGNAWVTNAGLGGAKLVGTRAAILAGKGSGSVTVIGPDFKPTAFSPIESDSFTWPLGLALDSKGNAWVASYFDNTVNELNPDGTVAGTFKLPGPLFPWATAIDGSDRVWVSGFSLPGVWLLCGENTDACPEGSKPGDLISPKAGYRNKAIQHLTSIQIDQSGNAWLSNNWSKLVPPTGGIGVVELIGVATPVCTPLLALPEQPSASGACPGGG